MEHVEQVNNWRVHKDEISSDHRAISFEITGPERKERVKGKNFNSKRANWTKFKRELKKEISGGSMDTTHDEANRVTSAVIKAVNCSIPKKTIFPKSIPW